MRRNDWVKEPLLYCCLFQEIHHQSLLDCWVSLSVEVCRQRTSRLHLIRQQEQLWIAPARKQRCQWYPSTSPDHQVTLFSLSKLDNLKLSYGGANSDERIWYPLFNPYLGKGGATRHQYEQCRKRSSRAQFFRRSRYWKRRALIAHSLCFVLLGQLLVACMRHWHDSYGVNSLPAYVTRLIWPYFSCNHEVFGQLGHLYSCQNIYKSAQRDDKALR